MAAIEYDPVKDDENRRKHGLPLALAQLLFHGPFVEEVDDRYPYGETRIVAIGPIAAAGDRIFVVVYTWRDNIRRIINVRKANDREVRKYRSGIA
jgi:uncharacterized DUF497 family protein